MLWDSRNHKMHVRRVLIQDDCFVWGLYSGRSSVHPLILAHSVRQIQQRCQQKMLEVLKRRA